MDKYRSKRRFGQTPEPEPGKAKSATGKSFVIHDHHSRQHHFDLRLEVNGALASWALPKGMPMDEGVRLLAVHVEDHPLEYGAFEGTIPKGEYGAGTVEIWDRGTYEPLHGESDKLIEEGKIEFELHGERLRGVWVLIRMKEEPNWLLLKVDKPVEAVLPESDGLDRLPLTDPSMSFNFQLCETKKVPPKGAGWWHEIKWDGYRAAVRVAETTIEITSRNHHRLNVPSIADLFQMVPATTLIDGELTVFDDKGVSSFAKSKSAIAHDSPEVVFVAFDMPFYNGRDLKGLPLRERKRLLREVIEVVGSLRVKYSDHTEDGAALYASVCKAGLEGVVSKRRNDPYHEGRSSSWIKARREEADDFLVLGYTLMQDSRSSIGALLLGMTGPSDVPVFCGKVGTGFSDEERAQFLRLLETHRVTSPPYAKGVKELGAVWVEPTVRVKVQSLGLTPDGRLRQPKYKGLGKTMPTPPKSRIKLSSGDRVIDPDSGSTKADAFRYYSLVAEEMLKGIAGRPLALVRAPEGVLGEKFFQKHWFSGLSASVQKVKVPNDSGQSDIGMAVNDLDGLMSLVQMGVIEIHVWGSHSETIEEPDILVFDLDPGDGLEWTDVTRAAREVSNQLESLGLKTFVRLTGGKGVHIVTPIKPELEWADAKRFCELLARSMAMAKPATYIATLSKERRKGRIFIDYLRNGRGATAVASFSLRARPGLKVACPIRWDEIDEVRPDQFTMEDALERLSLPDPWSGFEEAAKSLKEALEL